MKKTKLAALLAIGCVIWTHGWTQTAARQDAVTGPRPMTIQDVLAWKTISATAVSNDGQWFAYRIGPAEGDADVVVRQTQGDKTYRFGVGESGGNDITFSENSRWAAFSVSPTRREGQTLRRQRRPVQNKVTVLELATGQSTTFEKMQRFAFSGERSAFIALHKYGIEGSSGQAASSPAGGSPPAAGGTGSAPASDRPRGSDLILRELATGAELNIGNVAEFAFDRRGRSLAWIVDAADKSGNGLAMRVLDTGVVRSLDTDAATYERLTWAEKGDALAVVKGKEAKAYQDKLYCLVGITLGEAGVLQKMVFDPAADPSVPADMTVSAYRAPVWLEDLSGVLFGLQTARKKDVKSEAKPAERAGESENAAPPADASADERPDLVIWHWLDKRLQSQQQVQEQTDRRFSYLSVYRVKERRFLRLADEEVRDVTASARSRWAVGSDSREYERMGSMDGRQYRDIYAINLETGARATVVKKARHFSGASSDGSRFLYYDDGSFYVFDCATGQTTNITRGVPTSFVNVDVDTNVIKPPTSVLGWVSDGSAVWISDGWDIWQIPVSGGGGVNLTVDGRKKQIRYRSRYVLDREERGIDISKPQYLSAYGEWTKKAGIARLEPGRAGVAMLRWEDAVFGRVVKPKDADRLLFTQETNQAPPDFYASDLMLKSQTKLTTLDEQVRDFAWSSGARLVDYTVTLGKGGASRALQAALFLPANYEKGKAYPTIVYIYEKLSQGLNSFTTPTANGFNKSVYTSNGYAVLMPDIVYKVNDPGMSAVWCVLPALKAAIATGVVDAKRVGLHGHSWGGYQSAFLTTQTDAFAAIVSGAPLTNMISMYSLIYKNSGSTNQAIFESSQGRFYGPYNDNWEAYVRNSPVVHAKNVKTPIMLLHNDRDGAVDFTQGVEYYNTLRRLGKEVVLLEYVGENHSLAKPANRKDYTVRMREFFDHKLMAKPAPDWYLRGVSRLEMDQHLKDRAALVQPRPEKPEKKENKTAEQEKPIK